MSYAPLPTTAEPAGSRQGATFTNRWRSHLDTFSPRSATTRTKSFLDQLPPRTVRLFAWVGGVVVILIVMVSFNHAKRTSFTGSPLDSPRSSRLGEYSWLAKWKGSSYGVARAGADGQHWNQGLIDPVYTEDEHTGYLMPPDVYPAALNPYKRANAAFVALVRNNEREAMRDSMRSIEMRGNRKWGYPWVFMNDEPFDQAFIDGVKSITRSEVIFHVIPKEHWSYPEWINQTYAAEERQKMVNENVIYGGSESYRHMCRFNSGFFFQQKVLDQFKWYWRIEPGVEFFCDIDFDPFLFMQANKKTYGFTISLYEYRRTVETLWEETREFARLHPEYIHPDNAVDFLVDGGKGLFEGDWNNCHFWSNFEIADLDFWRSKPYMDYFNFLDRKGGFFYSRFGDAPIHSIAVALFLPKDKIIHLDPISYRHNPYTHCPQNNELFHDNGKCECETKNDFNTHDGYSCQPRWWDLVGHWNY
ncbi:glycosyltransferase family 15 protein [Sporobolomyces koalae]|uniref:glycosyltransferase family 15 protein n=1 Tax=Sporobolomyces koalae TaxID=500713 RepID=UPI00316EA57E